MPLVTDTPPAAPAACKRLKNYGQQRGTKTGFAVRGALLFGGVFVAFGIAIVVIGTGATSSHVSGVHAPYWVVTVCGACFAGGGLMVWGMAARQHRAEVHRREAMLRFAGQKAHADYAWNPRAYHPPRWKRAAQAVLGASFMTVFLSIFNWWAWGTEESPWQVKAIVVAFDLLLLLVWWKTVLTIGRTAKFSGSHVVFQRFPYRLSEPVAIRWMPPHGIGRADKGSFTFRCVEEYYEERRSKGERSRWLVHDELCAETQAFDAPQEFAPGRPVELRYTIPAGARPTCLSADRPVYWELEVKLSMAGLDFEEWYLVPVYA